MLEVYTFFVLTKVEKNHFFWFYLYGLFIFKINGKFSFTNNNETFYHIGYCGGSKHLKERTIGRPSYVANSDSCASIAFCNRYQWKLMELIYCWLEHMKDKQVHQSQWKWICEKNKILPTKSDNSWTNIFANTKVMNDLMRCVKSWNIFYLKKKIINILNFMHSASSKSKQEE